MGLLTPRAINIDDWMWKAEVISTQNKVESEHVNATAKRLSSKQKRAWKICFVFFDEEESQGNRLNSEEKIRKQFFIMRKDKTIKKRGCSA